ncbi:hypothetical protein [Nocardia sp. NPDC052566]|uniref:hypothetical protein n=1 Tax=Nocardia sp. NPDC052566 TaxID=3364330 RepID=UPI0037C9E3F7
MTSSRMPIAATSGRDVAALVDLSTAHHNTTFSLSFKLSEVCGRLGVDEAEFRARTAELTANR